MQKKKILRIIIILLIIIWMFFVFSLSNQNGNESSGLSRKIAGIIVNEESKIDIIEPIIRKLAHLSEYTFGGMLFCLLFLTYSFSDKKRIICSQLIGIEYASLDEIHQLFIEGRSGQISDVFIDSIGIGIGICIIMILYKILRKYIKKKEGVLNSK